MLFDAGYQGVAKRTEATGVGWKVALRPSKPRATHNTCLCGKLLDKGEQLKVGVPAKMKQPFRVIKCQFGFNKVRYKRLAKNAAHLTALFALSNLWMACRHLIRTQE